MPEWPMNCVLIKLICLQHRTDSVFNYQDGRKGEAWVFSLLSLSSPHKTFYYERSTDWRLVLMTGMRTYWLKMWEGWLHPFAPLQTNCICVWLCVSLDEKKSVVNSSCVFPAIDICCCCCVMKLRLPGRIKCSDLYIYCLIVTPSPHHHSWTTWEEIKRSEIPFRDRIA